MICLGWCLRVIVCCFLFVLELVIGAVITYVYLVAMIRLLFSFVVGLELGWTRRGLLVFEWLFSSL